MPVREPPFKRRKTLAGLPATTPGAAEVRRLRTYEEAMRRRVKSGKIPGCAACVINRGSVAHVSEIGYADLERRRPFTARTLVRAYCVTKTTAAVGILILRERGLLRLEDPVSRYLPAFRRIRVAWSHKTVRRARPFSPKMANKFTIWRLLTHTSGLEYGCDFGNEPSDACEKMYQPLNEAVDRGEVRTLEQYVDWIARLPLRHSPGKGIYYSLAADILGRIIEVVSGRRLDAFLEKEIFRPLKMRDTGFFVPRSKASRLAPLYGDREMATKLLKAQGKWPRKLPRGKNAFCVLDGGRPGESNWIQGRQCPVLSGGGTMGNCSGGIVTTLSDMARFFTMLLNGGVLGNRRLLQTSTVESFCFTDMMNDPQKRGLDKLRTCGERWNAWCALGELGRRRRECDSAAATDDYEEGEAGMAGVANTHWSVNPVRDQVYLWFCQSIGIDRWRGDGTAQKSSPENFVTTARATASRDAAAASRRRASLK